MGGKRLYADLVPRLEDIYKMDIGIPTEGLAIGEKLAWFGNRIEQ